MSCKICRAPIADGGRRIFLAFGPLFDFGLLPRVPPIVSKVFPEGDERYRQFVEQPCDGCTDFRSSL